MYFLRGSRGGPWFKGYDLEPSRIPLGAGTPLIVTWFPAGIWASLIFAPDTY